ncbi:MAG: bifunctional nuclease family protein [Euryarchaeota archaeon]|nr:bifunctional nuclease family protein [Euryarchaeota archaeon]
MTPPSDDDRVQVMVDKVLMTNQGGVVLLKTDTEPFAGRVLPIFVDVSQAVNIQMARTQDLPPRPFTHDLITTILNSLGALVVSLSIDDLAQNTFFSTINVELDREGTSRVETFDARPSDGIALALRADAPILVARSVLERASVDPEEFFAVPEEEGDDDLDDLSDLVGR